MNRSRSSASGAGAFACRSRGQQFSFGLSRNDNGNNYNDWTPDVCGGLSVQVAGPVDLYSTDSEVSTPNLRPVRSRGGAAFPPSPSSSIPNARTAAVGRSLLGRPSNARKDTRVQLQHSRPSAKAAAAAGLSLLHLVDAAGRFVLDDDDVSDALSAPPYAKFTASSADTPLPRASTDVSLKSCLSSSNVLGGSSTSPRQDANNGTKNDEFKTVRSVSFSHLRVREYEVTLGDNPSVSSGAPLGLGWRYKPTEKVSSLKEDDDDTSACCGRVRRSASELKMSDHERRIRLSIEANVTPEELRSALLSTHAVRMQRKESLEQLRKETSRKKEDALMVERQAMRRRRMGIVDGGLAVSRSLVSL